MYNRTIHNDKRTTFWRLIFRTHAQHKKTVGPPLNIVISYICYNVVCLQWWMATSTLSYATYNFVCLQ